MIVKRKIINFLNIMYMVNDIRAEQYMKSYIYVVFLVKEDINTLFKVH